MFELALAALTIGALLFHTAGLSLVCIAVISLAVGMGFFLWLPKGRGLVAAVAIALVFIVGALVVWSREYEVPRQVFGKRSFEATVLSTDRELDRTIMVIKDTEYVVRIQTTVYERMAVLPGDTVRIEGAVKEPEDFLTDTGRLFGYRAYLESKGIVATATGPQVTVVKKGGFGITRMATVMRYACADLLARHAAFPTDGIVSGMLLGYQGGLPDDVQDLFRTTGVLHVLVLSGYNITLLCLALGMLLKRVSQRMRIALMLFSMALLVLVSGAGVASVRAGMMGVIALGATASLERYDVFRAMSLSYLLFFLWSPLTIFSDPGFHLSFLATFCMIAVIPKAERLFSFIPKTAFIDMRELVMLAVLMPVYMLPYTMYFSGLAPLASVPANILLAVVTPVVMMLGIVVLALSWIAPLAALFGIVLSAFGAGTLWLLERFARLPLYNTPPLSWQGVVAFYGVSSIILFKRELRAFIEQLRSALLRQPSSGRR